MRYLVLDEMSMEDLTKIKNEDLAVHAEERTKGNIPKHIVADHIVHGDLPQFTQNLRMLKIYETNDPKQLANIDALWGAMDLKTWKRWIVPISEFDPARKMPWPAFSEYRKRLKR
jgi:hypothetical protein